VFGSVWQAEKQATQAATKGAAELNERKCNTQLVDNTAWSYLNLVEE